MAEKKKNNKIVKKKETTCQAHQFSEGMHVVYPAHGVGEIISVECKEFAGFHLELFVIQFQQERMILRIPVEKIHSTGIRALSSEDVIARAFKVLARPRSVRRVNWSRRTQIYEAKINSGDLVALAEVLRELYRHYSGSKSGPSYSERQIYEAALGRFLLEVAAAQGLSEAQVRRNVEQVLSSAVVQKHKTSSHAGSVEEPESLASSCAETDTPCDKKDPALTVLRKEGGSKEQQQKDLETEAA